MSEVELPIQNPDRADIVGVRQDGGVELFIVASGPLTAEPQIQKLLLDKVEAYLGYINSDEFKAEFENPPADRTTIIISCYGSVDPVIPELVERTKPWVMKASQGPGNLRRTCHEETDTANGHAVRRALRRRVRQAHLVEAR